MRGLKYITADDIYLGTYIDSGDSDLRLILCLYNKIIPTSLVNLLKTKPSCLSKRWHR